MVTCSTCGKRGVEVKLAYSTQLLCKSCFIRMTGRRIAKTVRGLSSRRIEDSALSRTVNGSLRSFESPASKIAKTVRENKLIEKDDKIGVAISGGKDSCLLLHWLVSYAKKRPGVRIVAIHVYRGDAYAVRLLKTCEAMCAELDVELHVASFSKELGVTFAEMVKLVGKLKTNRCSVCGVFRRRLLDVTARKLGCNKLATGHNLTDEAQSYLMNFIRNDHVGFGHLGPISLPKREGFVQRIKPLRDVPEEDIKSYVELKKWAHHPQACPCRVGSLRYNMLAVTDLLEKARPGVEFSIVKSGDWIRAHAIECNARGELRKCERCGEACSGEVCRVCQYLALKD